MSRSSDGGAGIEGGGADSSRETDGEVSGAGSGGALTGLRDGRGGIANEYKYQRRQRS